MFLTKETERIDPILVRTLPLSTSVSCGVRKARAVDEDEMSLSVFGGLDDNAD